MKEKRPCQCSIPTYWVSGATLRWSDHLVERAALCSTKAWKCAVQWPCWSAFHSECNRGPTLNSIHLKVTGCFFCTYCSSQWNHMHTCTCVCTASNEWPIKTINRNNSFFFFALLIEKEEWQKPRSDKWIVFFMLLCHANRILDRTEMRQQGCCWCRDVHVATAQGKWRPRSSSQS